MPLIVGWVYACAYTFGIVKFMFSWHWYLISREGNVFNQKLRVFILFYVGKISGNLVSVIFSLFGNKCWHKQDWEKFPAWPYFYFQSSFRINWRIWLKRYKMLLVSEQHELGDNETVCSCVTMRELKRPLVAILWHIAFWYRYHHLNVRILGSNFQLVFSMGARYFQNDIFYWKMISVKLSFTYIVE